MDKFHDLLNLNKYTICQFIESGIYENEIPLLFLSSSCFLSRNNFIEEDDSKKKADANQWGGTDRHR